MKSVIALISVVISSNAFSYSATDASVLTSASPLLTTAVTSGGSPEKQAVLILDAVQELELGKISPFLNQKIKEFQARHPDQSVADAIDSLVDEAQTILGKK
ncbi:MAG: hypothetical protein K2Q18_05860 [Bdellovibrionales bacterium]|nr:hypothetical protein [Bdellovibrionales bacterium]